jgi:parallel beta-helix repeat protein
VIVRAGHYAGLYLTTSGTAADPITFRGEPGAIVDTPNPTTPDGINLEGASYVIVEGFTVTGAPRAGIRSVVNHHVIIRDNTGDLNGRWGILTGFSDDILIDNNVMSRSQAHGIYVSNSGDRPLIRRNVVFGNRASGIHMNGDVSEGGDGIISGALVEDNCPRRSRSR